MAWLIDMGLLEDAIYEWESIQYINKMEVKDKDAKEELDEYWDNLKSWFNEYRGAGGEHNDLEREIDVYKRQIYKCSLGGVVVCSHLHSFRIWVPANTQEAKGGIRKDSGPP